MGILSMVIPRRRRIRRSMRHRRLVLEEDGVAIYEESEMHGMIQGGTDKLLALTSIWKQC